MPVSQKLLGTNTFSEDSRHLLMGGTRATRLGIVLVTTIAVLGLMMISIDPQVQHTVDEIMDNPDEHQSQTIFVRGAVVNNSIDFESMIFIISGAESILLVDFTNAAVPDGFADGRTVAVTGQLIENHNVWELSASEIQTGCPSKYES